MAQLQARCLTRATNRKAKERMSEHRPLILIADPEPRTVAMIFEPAVMEKLRSLGRVRIHADGQRLGDTELAADLAEATIVIGQIDLPSDRLSKMPKLKAVFNVEGNFFPNVDYGYCLERGIHVLNVSPVYATAVAETAFGMAMDLARQITSTHEMFRTASESWGLASNKDSFLLTGCNVGIVGLGDLGTALRRMLAPFRCKVRAYDPWLSERVIMERDCVPSTLDEVLSRSRIVFLFAGSTVENQGFIGAKELERMQRGSILLLMSRAGIVDFSALEEAIGEGRIRAGIDVFPVEPLPSDAPIRKMNDVILSSHRSGGMAESFFEIGRLVVADTELVLRGLPPQVCRRAERETVLKLRSRPVSES
jgi:phosphoglycerate dehydrogenase-like enzyme